MADEAGQKAMLYFIEVLMNSNAPLAMSQLAGRFGTKSFTPEMRAAAGANEEGLKTFLGKYPSLFHIEGNMVSVNNHGVTIPCMNIEPPESPNALSNVQLELNAVKYFKDKLLKKGGPLPVKSLAGHLSQAPTDMRNIVGPQSEFKLFLLKHKDIFVISEDDQVWLTEAVANEPKQSMTERSESDSSLDISPKPVKEVKKASPITMTASEYKTMKYVKELIETNEGKVSLVVVMKKVPDASDSVKNILGEDTQKLIDFVNKYPNIFSLGDQVVTLKKTRLNVIMAGSRPNNNQSESVTTLSSSKQEPDSLSSSITSNMSESDRMSQPPRSGPAHRTLNNHSGPVYHLAKLWGIIDLGKHEHVFFDRSILPDGYDDLAKCFKLGMTLRFNAVRAARGSRARWRATHIWRDGEDIRSMYGIDSTFSLTGFNSNGLDDEIKQLLPNVESSANSASDQYAYVDASHSNTGCIPVWTVNANAESGEDKGILSLSMMPESKYMHKSAMKDSKLIPGYMLVPTDDCSKLLPITNGTTQGNTREIGCQTISTGDIMATQLYQDGD